MHPILDSLNNSQHEWLKKLLLTFNEGNIGKFEALAPLFPKEVCIYVKIRNGKHNSVRLFSRSYKKIMLFFGKRFASWLSSSPSLNAAPTIERCPSKLLLKKHGCL